MENLDLGGADPYCPQKKCVGHDPLHKNRKPKLQNDGWGDNDNTFAEHDAMLKGAE